MLCFSVSMWPMEGDMQSLSLNISCIIDKCAEILWTHKALCLGHLDAKASQAPSCRGDRPGFNLPISEEQNLHEMKLIAVLWLTLEICSERVDCTVFLLPCLSFVYCCTVSIVGLFGLLLGPWAYPLLSTWSFFFTSLFFRPSSPLPPQF